MSASINPDIVTDGLVLCLDAANSDCFRGEPTTNKINGLYSTSFANSGFTITNNYDTNFDGSNTASLLLSGSWIARTAGYSSGFVSGNTYTTTWILKNVDMNTLSLVWGGVHTGTRVNVSINLTNGTASSASGSNLYGIYSLGDGWYAIWYVTTLSGTAHYPTLVAPTTGKYILYGGMQVEEKNYPTPIVDGTRGGTVATGGGLFDLSNNNNHGTIVRNAVPTASFYNSGNRGSLIFDGVNDYMQANVNTNTLDGDPSLTVDMFVRRRTGTNIGAGTGFWGIGGAGQGNSFEGWTPTANLIHLDVYDSTRLTTSEFYPECTFVHIAWTKNGAGTETANVKCYVNGVEVSLTKTRSATRTNQFNTSTNGVGICLGRINANSNYAHAPIDVGSFKVYDRALTAAEIQQNYLATKGRYGL